MHGKGRGGSAQWSARNRRSNWGNFTHFIFFFHFFLFFSLLNITGHLLDAGQRVGRVGSVISMRSDSLSQILLLKLFNFLQTRFGIVKKSVAVLFIVDANIFEVFCNMHSDASKCVQHFFLFILFRTLPTSCRECENSFYCEHKYF